MPEQPQPRKKITLPYLFEKVLKGEPITWLTCYDYPTAYLQEQAGIEMILVGDSLGMTMLGYESTLPVTMDDMIRHAQAVRRGAPTAFVIGDMPYMTYQPRSRPRSATQADSWPRPVATPSNWRAALPWPTASRASWRLASRPSATSG